MNVVILVFSPGGNTLKVARMLEEKMQSKNIEVQIVDTTRKNIFIKTDTIREFLINTVRNHDLICIGGPVYAHHMHYNVLKLIQALPKPGNGWGGLALPIITYGSISSGISLYESARLLKDTGRINVLGLKIAAFHCMSRIMATKINVGMPGKEAEPLINDLVEKIIKLDLSNIKENEDILDNLDYQSFKNKLKAKLIFNERFWQSYVYPQIVVDESKCVRCGKCINSCSVQRLFINESKLVVDKSNPACIHCCECITACKLGAIDFNANKERWNKMFKKAAEGHGLLPSNEYPKSVVYSKVK
ncbi:MAG: 4Fe-4S ferredoxin [Firmicutes bacterium]|nr:4Fe-4S ferredoxin [Bacillota bacterium]